jgi:hypothetical protein
MDIQGIQSFSKEMLIVGLIATIGIIILLMGLTKWWGKSLINQIKVQLVSIENTVKLTNIKVSAMDEALRIIHDGEYKTIVEATTARLIKEAEFVRVGNT